MRVDHTHSMAYLQWCDFVFPYNMWAAVAAAAAVTRVTPWRTYNKRRLSLDEEMITFDYLFHLCLALSLSLSQRLVNHFHFPPAGAVKLMLETRLV